MDDLNLPFMPPSIVERWLLANEEEEINHVLGEMIELYTATDTETRRSLDQASLHHLVEQIIEKLDMDDNAVRLSCIRLLKLIATDDHCHPFQGNLLDLFVKFQELIQDSSRGVRTATLDLACVLAVRIPFLVSGESILYLVENLAKHHDVALKVASIALLQLAVNQQKRLFNCLDHLYPEHQKHHTDIEPVFNTADVSDLSQHKLYLKRLATHAVVQVQRFQPRVTAAGVAGAAGADAALSDSSDESSDSCRGKAGSKKQSDAAIDLVTAASLALDSISKLQNRGRKGSSRAAELDGFLGGGGSSGGGAGTHAAMITTSPTVMLQELCNSLNFHSSSRHVSQSLSGSGGGSGSDLGESGNMTTSSTKGSLHGMPSPGKVASGAAAGAGVVDAGFGKGGGGGVGLRPATQKEVLQRLYTLELPSLSCEATHALSQELLHTIGEHGRHRQQQQEQQEDHQQYALRGRADTAGSSTPSTPTAAAFVAIEKRSSQNRPRRVRSVDADSLDGSFDMDSADTVGIEPFAVQSAPDAGMIGSPPPPLKLDSGADIPAAAVSSKGPSSFSHFGRASLSDDEDAVGSKTPPAGRRSTGGVGGRRRRGQIEEATLAAELSARELGHRQGVASSFEASFRPADIDLSGDNHRDVSRSTGCSPLPLPLRRSGNAASQSRLRRSRLGSVPDNSDSSDTPNEQPKDPVRPSRNNNGNGSGNVSSSEGRRSAGSSSGNETAGLHPLPLHPPQRHRQTRGITMQSSDSNEVMTAAAAAATTRVERSDALSPGPSSPGDDLSQDATGTSPPHSAAETVRSGKGEVGSRSSSRQADAHYGMHRVSSSDLLQLSQLSHDDVSEDSDGENAAFDYSFDSTDLDVESYRIQQQQRQQQQKQQQQQQQQQAQQAHNSHHHHVTSSHHNMLDGINNRNVSKQPRSRSAVSPSSASQAQYQSSAGPKGSFEADETVMALTHSQQIAAGNALVEYGGGNEVAPPSTLSPKDRQLLKTDRAINARSAPRRIERPQHNRPTDLLQDSSREPVGVVSAADGSHGDISALIRSHSQSLDTTSEVDHGFGGAQVQAHYAPQHQPGKKASQAPRPQVQELPKMSPRREGGTPSQSPRRNDTYEYIATEDIQPSSNPTLDLNKALDGLETRDWPEIFYTLNTFRQIVIHHPNVLVGSGALHHVVLQVMKRVDNLRSSLAKNALLTVSDFFKGLGKQMDPEVTSVVPLLLKRSIDSSNFVVESSQNALQAMIEHVSVNRSLPALLAHTGHRSAQVRANIALCIYSLASTRTEELGQSRDLDSCRTQISKLVQERTPEARAYARDAVRLMVEKRISTLAEFEAAGMAPDLLAKILRDKHGAGSIMLNSPAAHSVLTPKSSFNLGALSHTPSGLKRAASGRGNSFIAVDSAGLGAGAGAGADAGVSPFTPVRKQSAGPRGGDSSSSIGRRGRRSDASPQRQHGSIGGVGGETEGTAEIAAQVYQVHTPPRSVGRSPGAPTQCRQQRRSAFPSSFGTPSADENDQQHFVTPDSASYGYASNNVVDVHASGTGRTVSGNGMNGARAGPDGGLDAQDEHGPSLQVRKSLPSMPSSQGNSPLVRRSFRRGGGGGGGGEVGGSFNAGNGNAASVADTASPKGALSVSAAAKRAIEATPELASLMDLQAATRVKAWMERRDAMTKLSEVMVRHYAVLRDANKLAPCVDCLLERLEDGSAKIQMHTLTCLETVNEEEPFLLQHNLIQIVAPAILGSASSTNKPISAKSLHLLRLLFDTVAPAQVAQFLCHTALHDKEKLRLTALRFLADVMPVFCVDQDTVMLIVKKTIYPSVLKILFNSSTKGDVRVCAVEVVRSLQTNLGRAEKVWLWSDDPHQQEELKKITANV